MRKRQGNMFSVCTQAFVNLAQSMLNRLQSRRIDLVSLLFGTDFLQRSMSALNVLVIDELRFR